MNRLLGLVFSCLALLAGLLMFGLRLWKGPEPEWTSPSWTAVESLELGLEALEKAYHNDALERFDRALELDPELLTAQLNMVQLLPYGSARRQRLQKSLLTADLSGLTVRERFLIEHWRAQQGNDTTGAKRLREAYLAEHPNDPYAGRLICDAAWAQQDLETAERCYERLLAEHPNWVRAQAHLGYLAMAQGRFTEAEERFQTYLYIAPDQANPHDSMGELLILLGRYEEAEKALEKALEIKPDFCHSYFLLSDLYALSSRFEESAEALTRMRAQPGCAADADGFAGCQADAFLSYMQGDVEDAWQRYEDGCLERSHGANVLAYRVAVETGRFQDAAQIKERFRQQREEAAVTRPWIADQIDGALAHLDGVRLLREGDPAAAAERFAQAERSIVHWLGDLALYKLFNRLNLLYSLRMSGQDAKADVIERKIRAVNPRFLDDMRPKRLDHGDGDP